MAKKSASGKKKPVTKIAKKSFLTNEEIQWVKELVKSGLTMEDVKYLKGMAENSRFRSKLRDMMVK